MNLTEALKHARDFNNFFKAFKNIEEIIEAGSHLDQNIKNLEDTRDRIASDIEALNVHKAQADKLLSETKESIAQAKADQVAELTLARVEAEAEKKKLLEEIEVIKQSKMSVLAEHTDLMATLDSERKELEKSLATVKEELRAIKGKL